MAHRTRFAGYAGLMAAASMALTPAVAPVHAAEVAPQGTYGHAAAFHSQYSEDFSPSTYEAETSEYRRYRRGWRRGWRRHRHRGIRGGDVLAGVLVLGGIAAIASAANNNRRRDRDVVVVDRRYDDRRYDDRRYDDRRTQRRSNSGSGIDGAVDQCLNEIERDVRVDSVDGASRVAQGWVVTGTLFNGSAFTCQIDNNGRISGVDYNGFSGGPLGSASGAVEDNQWSDDRYADARAAAGAQDYSPAPVQQASNVARPAYPGGPLPGESFED